MAKGWNPKRNAFVQSLWIRRPRGVLALMMPLVFFLSLTDPRMIATLDAINRTPKEGGLVTDGLVFRYNLKMSPDGLRGEESTFNICTFWLVEALTRAGWRR